MLTTIRAVALELRQLSLLWLALGPRRVGVRQNYYTVLPRSLGDPSREKASYKSPQNNARDAKSHIRPFSERPFMSSFSTESIYTCSTTLDGSESAATDMDNEEPTPLLFIGRVAITRSSMTWEENCDHHLPRMIWINGLSRL